MTGRVEGKVALITGAARGQGRSHAVRLAQEGANIIAIDLCEPVRDTPHTGATEADLAETARQVEALDRRIVATKADVRDLAALQGAVDSGVAEFGRLDIVAPNAGISAYSATLAETTEEAWQDMIDIDLTGVWHTLKATIGHIRAGGRGGAIVITSSVAGLKGFANVGNYVAAKHGLVGLMRTAALELAPESIRVHTLHPTQVDTDMIMNETTYRMFSPELEQPTREDFARASVRTQELPVPWVESIDVSNALLFLVSDEARYITGMTMPIDAGTML
ncbi:mycofactocin-coupled SDR family oxidoreductase [Jatrophihabitans sp.]|uniref:mycofactocin-coupled SDR family oxidoreductase n=1 Tax=Jatrophihabitans sp. TaxID=1932789 RepID=UPI0030C6BDA2|nr:short-chain dehydrogenase/reductase [Jatrophihabitans sp.]